MASSFEGRIVVLGANGQLGSDIVRVATERKLDVVGLGHDQIEVTDATSVRKALSDLQPATVINTVAFHNVDQCEEKPEKAFQVNAIGARNVAQASPCPVVYVSTDSVFGEGKPIPSSEAVGRPGWLEQDLPSPINVYGNSKLSGEYATMAERPDSLVIRLGVLFGVTGSRGKGGTNFIDTILEKARSSSDPLKIVDDQWISPILSYDAAQSVLDLIDKRSSGVFHVVNQGFCTWHGLAREAVEAAKIEKSVERISASTFVRKSRRPANTILEMPRLDEVRGGPMPTWQDAVRRYVESKHASTTEIP